MKAGRAMRTKIPLLAVMVSALIMGAAGSAGAGDSSLQPMQLARLDNGSPRGAEPGRRPEGSEAWRSPPGSGPSQPRPKRPDPASPGSVSTLSRRASPPEMGSPASGDASRSKPLHPPPKKTIFKTHLNDLQATGRYGVFYFSTTAWNDNRGL